MEELEDKKDGETFPELSSGAISDADRDALETQSYKDDMLSSFAEASGNWFWLGFPK